MSNTSSLINEGVARVYPEWTLGDRLRKARRDAGFKEQRSFAAVLGISHGSVANYEDDRTRPNRLVLREWARITNVAEEWLDPETPVPTPTQLDRRGTRRGRGQVRRDSTCNQGPVQIIPFPQDRPLKIAAGQ